MLDECRKLIELYKKTLENDKENSLDEFDNEIIWTAEKVGLHELVKEIFEASPDPSKEGESNDDSALVNYKAHALLMTGESEQALSLYRKQLKNYKNEMEKDFTVFRWLGFRDTEISMIEKELHLNKIMVYTYPDDDANTALAAPFTGKWQCEENNIFTHWEMKENHQLCHYLLQTKNGDQWVDSEIAVTRYRLKQMDDKTIMEEYNVRSNVITVSEIEQVNDELHVKNMGEAESKIKVYKRMKLEK